MGWRRRQCEADKGTGRRNNNSGRGFHSPPPLDEPQGKRQSGTFWQKIGNVEYEVDDSGYTGQSRPASR